MEVGGKHWQLQNYCECFHNAPLPGRPHSPCAVPGWHFLHVLSAQTLGTKFARGCEEYCMTREKTNACKQMKVQRENEYCCWQWHFSLLTTWLAKYCELLRCTELLAVLIIHYMLHCFSVCFTVELCHFRAMLIALNTCPKKISSL